MGKRGFHFGIRDLLMCRSGCIANKLDEREWQDRWAKCLTMVRLEPYKPLLSISNSVEREIFHE